MTAGVSASLKKQCAKISFLCHILLDQSVTIFRNCFFSDLSPKFVNFYTFIFRFFTRV